MIGAYLVSSKPLLQQQSKNNQGASIPHPNIYICILNKKLFMTASQGTPWASSPNQRPSARAGQTLPTLGQIVPLTRSARGWPTAGAWLPTEIRLEERLPANETKCDTPQLVLPIYFWKDTYKPNPNLNGAITKIYIFSFFIINPNFNTTW